MEKYDICIVGGGIAGCACAYISSKLGLKSVLVEKNNYLGGLITGGLVIPVMKTETSGINVEFYNDLIEYAKKYNAQAEYFDKNKGWFNPVLLKIVLDQMLTDKNVDILFEMSPTSVIKNNDRVEKIEIESNLLSLSIEAKYFLDATGDSKIFKLLGEDFFENSKEKQPSSLRFIMDGVDIKKFRKFIEKIDSNRNVTNSAEINNQIHLTTAYTFDDKGWNLKPIFDKAVKNGDLTYQDTSYFQLFTVAGANGSIAFNCPRLEDFDYNNPFDYSQKLIEARKAIYRISKFMTKYFKGFENAYISQIADMTGKRETNKIVSKKQVTYEDLTTGIIPETSILSGDYPIDVHSNKQNDSKLLKTGKYYIGIDSLISKNYSNLYAAGRNLGADKLAQGALRTQISCMSMGEGVARHVNSCVNNVK